MSEIRKRENKWSDRAEVGRGRQKTNNESVVRKFAGNKILVGQLWGIISLGPRKDLRQLFRCGVVQPVHEIDSVLWLVLTSVFKFAHTSQNTPVRSKEFVHFVLVVSL